METMAKSIAYRRLRAPRQDGVALCDPPLSQAWALLQQNVSLNSVSSDLELGNRRLSELRWEARQELQILARAYTSEYRDVPAREVTGQTPVILAGHQPDLVHPGVWFKNFVLSSLAEQTEALAVNLLIDNDAVRGTAVRVPTGSWNDPVSTFVPLDDMFGIAPFETRRVRNRQLFSQFGRRAAQAVRPLVGPPLVESFWPLAEEAVARHGYLGRALAEARHRLEGQWGLTSLELPLSQICDTNSFRWFAATLLHNAPRFRDIHNRMLADYRRVNRIRSHTHPVPDLAARDGWQEVPFWLWTREKPERRPAFIRQEGTRWTLSDQRDVRRTLGTSGESLSSDWIDRLNQMHDDGVRLRPRALITTMFARLVLSDLFIHGIGGAKYDELTDAIVRQFLGIEPPGYLVATATLKLPGARLSVEERDIAQIDRLLRELEFHPEVWVDHKDAADLMAEKQKWVSLQVPRHERRWRHAGIEQANRALRILVNSRREELLAERSRLRSERQKQMVLDSREYAFCLFPEEPLRTRLLDLSRQEP
jgi:hypothetical protein